MRSGRLWSHWCRCLITAIRWAAANLATARLIDHRNRWQCNAPTHLPALVLLRERWAVGLPTAVVSSRAVSASGVSVI